MNKDELNKILKTEKDDSIALVLMDICTKEFNETNFTHYDLSINIFFKILKLVHDGVITKERSKAINKAAAKLVNEGIQYLIDKNSECE